MAVCLCSASFRLLPPLPALHSARSTLPLPPTRSLSVGSSRASRRRRPEVVSASASERRPDGHREISAWDEKPYRVSRTGEVRYLDELDIISFLDPPKELIPIDRSSYNPAAYLWKKIGDIPKERRHRLLYLMKDRLISILWQLAETRYLDAKLAKKTSSGLLSLRSSQIAPETWNCRISAGPLLFPWLDSFQKVIFHSTEGGTYGRIILGGSMFHGVGSTFCPLYFTIREACEVLATEQPCDLAYEFGDGLLDIPDFPDKFPKPAKHLWPFNDQMVIYIRHVGPGVAVGQAWQEGKELEQVPKKFYGEILMVKAYD